MEKKLTLSTLAKTWIFDFDGTLVEHNGYKTGEDKWLPGAKEFLENIPESDYILILTGRELEAKEQTEDFLKKHKIRYNKLICGMPLGERILLNDSKPSGLVMSHAVECSRNEGLQGLEIVIDESL